MSARTLLCMYFISMVFRGLSQFTSVREHSKIGVDEPAIWLSIIGEVYDVTKGNEYYAQGSGYGVFAGRDASVAFMTGNFTPEEAEKSLDVLKNSELIGVVSWRDFYRDHEVYQFVGLLEDERYYDAEGKPTQPMIELGKRIKVAQQEEEVKAKERAIARKKRKEAKAKAKLATK